MYMYALYILYVIIIIYDASKKYVCIHPHIHLGIHICKIQMIRCYAIWYCWHLWDILWRVDVRAPFAPNLPRKAGLTRRLYSEKLVVNTSYFMSLNITQLFERKGMGFYHCIGSSLSSTHSFGRCFEIVSELPPAVEGVAVSEGQWLLFRGWFKLRFRSLHVLIQYIVPVP